MYLKYTGAEFVYETESFDPKTKIEQWDSSKFTLFSPGASGLTHLGKSSVSGDAELLSSQALCEAQLTNPPGIPHRDALGREASLSQVDPLIGFIPMWISTQKTQCV